MFWSIVRRRHYSADHVNEVLIRTMKRDAIDPTRAEQDAELERKGKAV